MLSIMKKRPSDEDLMNLFVLQLDVNLPQNHEFGVEYLLWFNRPPVDPIRSYDGVWSLVHDWVRRKRDTKNRREALKDHLVSEQPWAMQTAKAQARTGPK